MTWLYAGVMVVVTPAVVAVSAGTVVLMMFCILHVCVPVGGESDKAKRSGFIQGGAFFLSDIVKTLQPSGETNAREDGNVQGRRDQIFAAAHC